MSQESGTQVRYWGTRGSLPSPGPETVVFGGNTSCVEIRADGARWILDTGTGVRNLGAAMAREDGDLKATTFRVGHMGDHDRGRLERLLAAIA